MATSMWDLPAVPADLKGKERGRYDDITNNEKAGFLLYRARKLAGPKKINVSQLWRIPVNWKKLSNRQRRGYVSTAVVAAARAAGPPGAEPALGFSEGLPKYVPDEDDDETARITAGVDALNSNWVYQKTLYDNTEGRTPWREITLHTAVCLYYLIDPANSVVTDRIVVKRVHCPEESHVAHLLKDAVTTESLSFCDNIIKLRTYAPDTQNSLLFRIYLEYCPHGDLGDLLARYDPDTYTGGQPPDRQIPEPFLWSCFYSLAEGLFALNTGLCAENEEAANRPLTLAVRPGWDPLAHRDIKPANILLDTPSPPYIGYPKPLLADFDVTIPFGPQTVAGANREKGGTPFWQAPEVDQNRDVDLSSKTDVWNIGMIMWNLMHSSLGSAENYRLRQLVPNQWSFDQDDDTWQNEEGIVRNWDGWYSEPLRDLVRWCLKTNMEERPSFLELRNETKKGLDKVKTIMGDFYKEEKTLKREHPHLWLDFIRQEFTVWDNDESDDDGHDNDLDLGSDGEGSICEEDDDDEDDGDGDDDEGDGVEGFSDAGLDDGADNYGAEGRGDSTNAPAPDPNQRRLRSGKRTKRRESEEERTDLLGP